MLYNCYYAKNNSASCNCRSCLVILLIGYWTFLLFVVQYVPRDHKIHCHCFTTHYRSALEWTSRFPNLFIGLTPLVTYHSAVEIHEVAQQLELDRLLLETDAPYFLPGHFQVLPLLFVNFQMKICCPSFKKLYFLIKWYDNLKQIRL